MMTEQSMYIVIKFDGEKAWIKQREKHAHIPEKYNTKIKYKSSFEWIKKESPCCKGYSFQISNKIGSSFNCT